MGSDEEFVSPPPGEDPSLAPSHQSKLRRLRNASSLKARVPEDPTGPLVPAPPSSSLPISSPPAFPPPSEEIAIPEVRGGGGGDVAAKLGADLSSPFWGSDSPRIDGDDGLDPLIGNKGKKAEKSGWDVELDLDGLLEDDMGCSGGFGDAMRKKRSAKKRLSLDEGDGDDIGEKKQSRRKKKLDGAGKPTESARTKRKLEKERKAYLDQLHAESQKLLRETRDASFKPVALVQKPISSILKKIRQRKSEMLKKYNIFDDSDASANDIGLKRLDSNSSDASCDMHRGTVQPETEEKGKSSLYANAPQNVVPENSANFSEHCDMDLSLDSPFKITEKLPEDNSDHFQENDAPSLSKKGEEPDSDNSSNTSSDEEDNNKENTNPLQDRSIHVDSYKKTGLAKAFLDDEAEEEDDSDHDLMRFQEEDNDSEDSEEIFDLIAMADEEKPVDQEKRNELHQKWLEQQDAADTDSVLLRLKNTGKKRDATLLHDERDAKEELGEDSEGYSFDVPIPANSAKQNSKKTKLMIAQMFDDQGDNFVSSDDEENEQNLSRQRLLMQAETKSSVLSPVEDENSKCFFGLIKRLNTTWDPKKKTKPVPPIFETLIKQGNDNSSSKSSFLGRATSNSLPSSLKKGPVRSFIFCRDDSNSRSGILKSESLSEMKDQNDIQPAKSAIAKFSSSQTKSINNKRSEDSRTTGPSLFEILRRSSMQFDQQLEAANVRSHTISETQAAYQLTAFKIQNRVPRKSV